MEERDVDNGKEAMADKEKKLFKLIGTQRGKLSVLIRKRNKIDPLIEAGHIKEEVEAQALLLLEEKA